MADKLSESPVWATMAVKDLARARKFYEETLGYEPMMESDDAVTYKGADGTGLTIYPSEANAGTNKATAATWRVEDMEELMSDLRDKGVEFEDYDQPGLKTEDGIAKWEQEGKTMRAAWFKDPDGNILALIEM